MNPFIRVARPRADDRLLIGLHSEGLIEIEPGDRWAIELLCQRAEHAGLVVFVSNLHPPPPGSVTEYELTTTPDWHASATVRRSAEEYTQYSVLGANQAPFLAERHLGDADRSMGVVELMAMHDMGAHLIVTSDPAVITHRDEGWLADLNVVTPGEALVLAGLWSRASGRVDLAPPEPYAVWGYYWALARAITPAGWPAFSAWVEGERTLPNGRDLLDLAESVFERLSTNLRSLDRLGVLWLQPATNAGELETSAELDNILLRTWAIQDNLALLSGHHLGITLKKDMQWSLLNPEWLKAVRAHGPQGRQVAELAESLADRLRLAQQFRHHAAHRALLRPMISRHEFDPARIRVSVPGETADVIVTLLANLGESREEWGLGEETPEGEGTVVIHKGGGKQEQYWERFPRTVYLDPIPFVMRLTASTAGVANRFLEVLDPASDSRLSSEQRLSVGQRQPPDWGAGERAWEIIMTSPIAGLTPWVSR